MTKTIELSKGKVAIVDDDMYDYLGQWNWYAFQERSNWYAIRKDRVNKNVYMHRVVTGAGKGETVDHANGNGLDNRRSNLRVCTLTQNNFHKRVQKNNSTGFKGVFKHGKKFGVRIVHHGKPYRLGVFSTPEEAARAYNEKAKELFGKFAWLNPLSE